MKYFRKAGLLSSVTLTVILLGSPALATPSAARCQSLAQKYAESVNSKTAQAQELNQQIVAARAAGNDALADSLQVQLNNLSSGTQSLSQYELTQLQQCQEAGL